MHCMHSAFLHLDLLALCLPLAFSLLVDAKKAQCVLRSGHCNQMLSVSHVLFVVDFEIILKGTKMFEIVTLRGHYCGETTYKCVFQFTTI